MLHKFDPQIFVGQPMRLAGCGENDFRVMIVCHCAGHIFETMRGSGKHIWFWAVTGPYLPGACLTGNAESDDLPAAKAAFRATFDSWFAWAIRQNAPAAWYE